MKIKFVLSTPSGSVEYAYADVTPSPGGYISASAAYAVIAQHDWLLNDGDRITTVFLDQCEPDELTEEDERFLGRR